MHSRALAILVCAALLGACHALQRFVANRAGLRTGCLVAVIQLLGAAVSCVLDVLMSGFGRAARRMNTAVPVSPGRRSCESGKASPAPSTTSLEDT